MTPNPTTSSGQSSMPVAKEVSRSKTNPRLESLFFSGMASVILIVVFIGFARSYFLAGVLKAPLPSLLIHLHGAAFTAWVILFIVQTSLVATRRIKWHRQLGLLSFGLACAMVIVGLLASMQVLARPPALGVSPRGPRAFFAVPISDLLVFSVLIYFGFRKRFDAVVHKRFMLVATIALLDAAFVRWPIHQEWWTLRVAQTCCYPLLALLVAYDVWFLRRIHIATVLACVFLVFAQQIRSPIGRSRPWQHFAESVQKLSRELF